MSDYSSIVSVSELQTLYLPQGLRGVSTLSTNVLEMAIDASCEQFRTLTGIPLGLHRLRSLPDYDGLVKGVDYDEKGRLLPYHYSSGVGVYRRVNIPCNNLIEIKSIRGCVLGVPEVTFPLSWANIDLRNGFFELVPNDLSDPAFVAQWEACQGRIFRFRFLPGFWAIDYDYGLVGNDIPADVKLWIGINAAVIALKDLPLAGLSSGSMSMDGVSKSGTGLSPLDLLKQSLAQMGKPEQMALALKKRHRGVKVFST